MGSTPAFGAVAPADPEAPRARHLLAAAGMTPGVWLGIVGFALIVAASLLPWYTISAQVPPAYPQMTTIIQFDGISGLYVHPDLRTGLGLGVPSVGFPIAVIFVISALFKIRKIIRSSTRKMRAATLARSSIMIAIPLVATFIAISMLPSFLPASAPTQAHALARAVSAQPLGGSTSFEFPGVGTPLQGTLQWGFGPALWVMIGAAVLMNLASKLEMRAYRKAAHALEMEQAERLETAPPR